MALGNTVVALAIVPLIDRLGVNGAHSAVALHELLSKWGLLDA